MPGEHTMTIIVKVKTNTETTEQRRKLCQRLLRNLTIKLGADRVEMFEALLIEGNHAVGGGAYDVGDKIIDPRGDT